MCIRDRSWFDGRLATLGASYLGWAQWALMQDPPPELRAAVVLVGPHDFREAVFGTGAFTVGDFLGWSDMIAHQEDGGWPARVRNGVAAPRRIRPGLLGLPMPDAAEPTRLRRISYAVFCLKKKIPSERSKISI